MSASSPLAASALRQAAASLSNLPLDILSLIFANFRLRPRIIVLALVCKRWREGVLRSITTLPLYAPASYLALPSLTSLYLPRRTRAILQHDLPPTLRSLEYRCRIGTSCACAHLRFLTGLTSLKMFTSCSTLPHALLLRNTGLTELQFRAWVEEDIPNEEAFKVMQMPKLVALTFDTSYKPSVSFSIVKSMAPQLTSLVIFRKLWLSENLNLVLPHCRRVVLSDLEIDRRYIDRLPIMAPQLREIKLNGLQFRYLSTGFHANFPYSAIVKLSVSAQSNRPRVGAFIAACCNLRSLTLNPDSFPDEPTFQSTLDRLQKLKLWGHCEGVNLTRVLQATQLTYLLVTPSTFGRMAAHWPFKRLECLRIAPVKPAVIPANSFPSLTAVIQVSNLKRLGVFVPQSPAILPQLRSTLEAAEQRGVEFVRIVKEETVSSEQLVALMRRVPWLAYTIEYNFKVTAFNS